MKIFTKTNNFKATKKILKLKQKLEVFVEILKIIAQTTIIKIILKTTKQRQQSLPKQKE